VRKKPGAVDFGAQEFDQGGRFGVESLKQIFDS
jgi:hypothetical protein